MTMPIAATTRWRVGRQRGKVEARSSNVMAMRGTPRDGRSPLPTVLVAVKTRPKQASRRPARGGRCTQRETEALAVRLPQMILGWPTTSINCAK
jgi:hypothetical protein